MISLYIEYFKYSIENLQEKKQILEDLSNDFNISNFTVENVNNLIKKINKKYLQNILKKLNLYYCFDLKCKEYPFIYNCRTIDENNNRSNIIENLELLIDNELNEIEKILNSN